MSLNLTTAVSKYNVNPDELELMGSKVWVFDAEADGLLHEMTHFHCLVFKKYKDETWYVFCKVAELTPQFRDKYEALGYKFFDKSYVKRFLANTKVVDTLVCHNQLGYDLEAMRRFLGIDYTIGFYNPDTIADREIKIIDSLVWSRYLNPERRVPFGCPTKIHNPVTNRYDTVGAHGLAAWGFRVGNKKPEVHDWIDQHLNTYVYRCIEDVKINEGAFTMLRSEKADVARNAGSGLKGDWDKCLEEGKYHYYAFCKQERDGAHLDVDFAAKLRDYIDVEMEKLASFVEPQLPLRVAPKTDQPNFPAKPFLKSGELSVSGKNWFEKWRGTVNYIPEEETQARKQSIWDYQDSVEYREKYILKVPMQITNQDDVKKYLASQGWKPTIWNTKNILVDSNKKEVDDIKKHMNAVNYIEGVRASVFRKGIFDELELNKPQRRRFMSDAIDDFEQTVKLVQRHGRFLPSTPKLKDQVSGKLCENLMIIDGDIAKAIVKYMSMGNRRSVIQARDEKKSTGWLNNPRIAVDSRIGARTSGLTNTHRQKHKVIVNVPKADPRVLLGQEMRSVFTAPENYYNIGWDAAALENRVGGHFCFPFDGGAYAKMMLEGDCHTEMAEAYTTAAGFGIGRSAGKNVTYGTMYGAQAKKLAKMLGVPLEVGRAVFEAFWNKNVGLKMAREALERYWDATDKKYIIGIDGSKVYTRSKHSLLNCLFQHAGAKICTHAFCAACAQATAEGLDWQRWGEFHDEMQAYQHKSEVERNVYDLTHFGDPTKGERGEWVYVMPPMEHSGKIYTKPLLDLDRECITQYYSRVGEIGVETMREAGKFYNLNLPLDADYMVGLNWKECH